MILEKYPMFELLKNIFTKGKLFEKSETGTNLL